jgi:F-type H+-transporting ATPase subunit gamma
MPSLKVIRTRIASVKSTQKITKAMKMVAGARLNRAQQAITALRPYAIKTGDILRSVASSGAPGSGGSTGSTGPGEGADAVLDESAALHPFLARRPESNVLIVLFSGDRGLCGAFNTNVNKAAERQWRELEAAGKTVSFVTLGRKGKEYLTRRGAKIVEDFPKPYEGLDMAKARRVAAALSTRFKAKEFDAVYIVFNEFKSAITQKATLAQLLPLAPAAVAGAATGTAADARPEFLFEPDKKALVYQLVPMYLEITLFRAMLESQAGFFGAQMTAMDSATRNAKDMIKRLSLAYNRARQAAITKELMEIIGGAEALKE